MSKKKAKEVKEKLTTILNSLYGEKHSLEKLSAEISSSSEELKDAEDEDGLSDLTSTIDQILESYDNLKAHIKNLEEVASSLFVEQNNLKNDIKHDIISNLTQQIDDKISEKVDNVEQRLRSLEQGQEKTEEKLSAQEWKLRGAVKHGQ